jgi:uncharacterized protein (DUF2141 family)
MNSLFLLPLFLLASLHTPAPDTEIELIIKNIKSPKGSFVISFYNLADDFPKPGHERSIQRVTVGDTLPHDVKITMPEGWYAIAMYQDELDAGKIKRDKIGIPEEPYAFSNNIHPKMEAPSYAACKFYVSKDDTKPMEIDLIQPHFQVKP